MVERNPVIWIALMVQAGVTSASRVAGAIVGYIITTGVLVWGLSVYRHGGYIEWLVFSFSRDAFVRFCLVWYVIDSWFFIVVAAKTAVSAVKQRFTSRRTMHKRERYLESNPDDYQAWAELGRSRLDAGDLEGAQAAYDRALEIDPEGFDAWIGLGALSRTRGNRERAVQCYEKALEINPDYAEAYSSLAVLALQAGQDARGLEHAERAREIEKRNPAFAAILAVAYHYNGMYEERDSMTGTARILRYRDIDTLQKIYDGTISIRAL